MMKWRHKNINWYSQQKWKWEKYMNYAWHMASTKYGSNCDCRELISMFYIAPELTLSWRVTYFVSFKVIHKFKFMDNSLFGVYRSLHTEKSESRWFTSTKGKLDFYLWSWQITPNKKGRVLTQNHMYTGYGKQLYLLSHPK